MNRFFLLSVFFVFLLFFPSCSEKFDYQKTYQFDQGYWTYADSLSFDFEIPDTNNIYSLFLEVQHGTDYSYENLYTNIKTIFPSGRTIENPLSLELADKTGKWYGNCSGKNCKYILPIQEKAYFNETGNFQLKIEQYMREDSIEGINGV
ncbi:MAG: gliding motility lipoprotein GldH, partial [Bacteroidota bacterium]